MSVLTTLMGLGKAVDGDNAKTYLETVLGGALDAIDGHTHENGKGAPVKRIQFGLAAARPAFGNAGHVYFATDTGAFSTDNGTAWVDQAGATNTLTLTNKTIDSANNTLTIRNAALGTDTARLNLLVNGGFEICQRGGASVTANGAFGPDRWQLNFQGTGAGSLVKDTTNQDTGAACAALASSAGGTIGNYVQLMQKLEDYVQLRGRTLTLALRVKASVASNVVLQFADGVTGSGAWQSSGVTSVGTGYQTLTFSFTPAATATSLFIGVGLQTVATLYCDSATLVVGSVPMDYLPLTPADDLARCLRYYQRWAATALTQGIANGQAYTTAAAVFHLPLMAAMGGAPTLTVSAVADWGAAIASAGSYVVASGLSVFASATPTMFNLNFSTATASLVAGNATFLASQSISAWLALEWNP